MSKSGKLFVILLVLASFCIGAYAQTPPSSSTDYTFRGFYVGANVGGAWGNANTRFTPLPDATSFSSLMPTTLAPDPSGFLGGGQAGYNWVSDSNWMFGLETDMQGASIDGTHTVTPIIDNSGASAGAGTFLMAHHETNWLGTLRARAGYVAAQRWLIYGTVGMAYGGVKWAATTDYTATGGVAYPAAQDETKVGWSAGGGIEFLASRHVSLRGEYLYVNLRDTRIIVDAVPANPPFQLQYNFSSNMNVFRGGVNFKF